MIYNHHGKHILKHYDLVINIYIYIIIYIYIYHDIYISYYTHANKHETTTGYILL